MKAETREQLEFTKQLGFYQRADIVVRLFAEDDVGEILGALEPAFRDELIDFARRAYLPEGAPMTVAGPPLPAACLAAFQTWLRAHSLLAMSAQLRQIQAASEALARTIAASPALSATVAPRAPASLPLVEIAAARQTLPRRRLECT